MSAFDLHELITGAGRSYSLLALLFSNHAQEHLNSSAKNRPWVFQPPQELGFSG
jgi:hypothetical protein